MPIQIPSLRIGTRPSIALGLIVIALGSAPPVPAQVQATEIVYVKQNGTLFEMRKRLVTGTTDTKLFAGCLVPGLPGYCAYLDPAIAPDGKRLVFVHDAVSEEFCKTIWIADLNGRNARQVTTGCNHIAPSWSPDGRRIAFQDGDAIKEVELCRNTLPERNPAIVTTGRSPSYSPDGRWIAFARSGHVYKIRRTGTGEAVMAGTSILEFHPRWTKPGWNDEKILYLFQRVGGNQIYWMSASDGSGKQSRTDVAPRDDFDVAVLPTSFVWAHNGELFFKAGSNATRSLGPGRDPVFGHGTVRAASCP